MADIYRQAWYDGETFGQYDRNDLARLAEKYYERLCDFQANEYELYEYARLVYSVLFYTFMIGSLPTDIH